MCNIHAIEIIPSQAAIDSIAIYRAEFDSETLDYNALLNKLKSVIHELGFMEKHDNTEWMQTRGNEIEALQGKLSPQILKCALTRLEQFK